MIPMRVVILKKTNIVLILSLMILTLAGIIYMKYTWTESLKEMSENALKTAGIAEEGLNGEMIKKLTAEPENSKTIAYKSIKKRLKSFIHLCKNIQYIYIYLKKEDGLYFAADSESEESRFYSPPGKLFIPVSDEYYKPFDNRETLITRHSVNSFGPCISILVPMKKPGTDEIIAVFATDYPAGSWTDKAFLYTAQAGAVVVVSFLLFISFYIIINKNILLKSEIESNYTATQALRDSEEKYRVIFNNKHYAVCIFDFETLKFLDVNDAFISMYGFNLEELVSGMKVNDCIAEQKETDILINLSKINSAFFIPLQFHRKKDGKVFPVEIVGEQYEWRGRKVMFGMSNDITARKEAEKKLEEINKYLNNLFNHANAPIIVWDPQLKIRRFNRAFETITGRSASEVTGKPLDILFPSEQVDVSLALIEKTLNGEYLETAEIAIRHVNGSVRILLWNSATLFSDEGNIPVATIAQGQDITERILAENKIKALLMEKELILKEVHHRIKNFMNTIKSLVFMQIDSLKDPSAISALQDIENRIFSMMLLYDKLYHSDSFIKVSVPDYISCLVDEIVCNFPNSENVKIKKEFDDFKLDSKILQPVGIIINEILTNIMKYAFTDRNNGLIAVTARINGNTVSIEIADNGVGIPESVNIKNPESFGMELVAMLTEQIGGNIKIERGNGTKFILKFNR